MGTETRLKNGSGGQAGRDSGLSSGIARTSREARRKGKRDEHEGLRLGLLAGFISNRDGDNVRGSKLGGERWPMNLIRGVRCSAAWRKIRVGYISGVLGLSAKAI